MNTFSVCAGLLGALLVLCGCGREGGPTPVPPFPSKPAGQLEILYPLDETLFPPEIVAPTVVWEDKTEGVVRWQVMLRFHGRETVLRFDSAESRWRPSEQDWTDIKQQSIKSDTELAVIGLDTGGIVAASATVRIRTSTDPVEDAIFYREVPLPFIRAVQDPSRIRWRFGAIDSQHRPPVVLENLPVCGNCHSFSGDGGILGLDVDYGNDKGGYAILPVEEQMVLNDEKIITWSDYRRDDGEATFGLLSQISPDGRYVISTVKDRAVFVATPGIEFSQLFFPIKGILAVYDTVEGTYKSLPGADDPGYVQSNPTWSPDGQSVVFARAKVYRNDAVAKSNSILLNEQDVPEFIENQQPYKFDLYRVPFNGGLGGKAEPIAGASHNGKSNFFAKFSPDGQWIVFTQAENYMLLMPDSALYIIPAAGGEARRLRANTAQMNSWHSFSSNGRWLVFSSKVNTPYTQLFLTHIDEEGRSSPPVVLDWFTGSDRAGNIPEFVPLPAGAIARIQEQFLDAYSFLRAGMANERTGNYSGAVRSYERGLAVEPGNVELLNAKGFALFQQGKSEAAAVALEKALKIDPKHRKSHNNMALVSIEIGELELAEAHYRESLAIEPQAAIYNDLGFVLERQGLPHEAMEMYRRSLELDPESAAAHFNLATALLLDAAFQEAETHFRAVIAQQPSTQAYAGLGIALIQQGHIGEGLTSLQSAIEADPKNTAAYDHLASTQVQQGKLEAAASTYRRRIRNQPSVAAYTELARVLARLGHHDAARRARANAKAMRLGKKAVQ
ncbi:tetratricopeptide repeat protein [Microbulbifer spongiae]|uniref:Tetratricopeptide repeat protein n=1 Tax=Microbulbifer spongiae TaxID=2944933 RepID=A0ABY9E9X1_9GAMM|nr:tetratricopeptide repeat protein [Microbulbifer sp. MI-G]WKD49255.1 tetratricopeptide repeat protein [Microbulbifer sp. MI-G]